MRLSREELVLSYQAPWNWQVHAMKSPHLPSSHTWFFMLSTCSSSAGYFLLCRIQSHLNLQIWPLTLFLAITLAPLNIDSALTLGLLTQAVICFPGPWPVVPHQLSFQLHSTGPSLRAEVSFFSSWGWGIDLLCCYLLYWPHKMNQCSLHFNFLKSLRKIGNKESLNVSENSELKPFRLSLSLWVAVCLLIQPPHLLYFYSDFPLTLDLGSVVCVFRGICPFHLGYLIYCHTTVHWILL